MEKYTVIIPTRDRAETLSATIRTCLRQTYPNFEIIVSDNCSEDNTKDIVQSFNDQRIKYINPGKRLSMSGNFEYSLRHITEGFVMFIGSDDGLMPDAIEYVDSIVQKFKVDAVSGMLATYVWPEFPDKSIAGNFTFGGLRDDIELRNSAEWVQRTISFNAPYCFELPNLYCGFVNKKIIDKAYINGQYFRSITPDAYSAFVTALFIDEYAFSHKPFCIAGASAKSNGASNLNPKGDTKESVKFFSENDISLSLGFIKCASYEVTLGEAFVQAKNAFPMESKSYQLDYKSMLRKSIENANEKTKSEVHEAVEIMSKNFSSLINIENCTFIIPNKKGMNKLHILIKALSTWRIIVSIPSSYKIGINNVDDAALAARFLTHSKIQHSQITRGNILFNRLAAIFKKRCL